MNLVHWCILRVQRFTVLVKDIHQKRDVLIVSPSESHLGRRNNKLLNSVRRLSTFDGRHALVFLSSHCDCCTAQESNFGFGSPNCFHLFMVDIHCINKLPEP